MLKKILRRLGKSLVNDTPWEFLDYQKAWLLTDTRRLKNTATGIPWVFPFSFFFLLQGSLFPPLPPSFFNNTSLSLYSFRTWISEKKISLYRINRINRIKFSFMHSLGILRATDYFQSEKPMHNIFPIPVYKAQMESREKVPASVTY